MAGAGDVLNTFLQLDETQKQRQWSEKMTHQQNAWNTPVAQKARMREAGLNPALMYGQGTTGNQPSPSAMYQKSGPIQGPDMMSTYLQAKTEGARVENMKADTKLKGAQARSEMLGGLGIDITNKTELEEYLRMMNTRGDFYEGSTLDTEYKALENLAKQTQIQGQSIENKQKHVQMMYEEFNQVLAGAKTIKEIQRLGFDLDIDEWEWNYFKENKVWPRESVVATAFTEFMKAMNPRNKGPVAQMEYLIGGEYKDDRFWKKLTKMTAEEKLESGLYEQGPGGILQMKPEVKKAYDERNKNKK